MIYSHINLVIIGSAGMDSEEEWDGDCLGIEECLFCSFISESLEANVKHMVDTHSFFIPDLEYLSDLEGLITYLGNYEAGAHIHSCVKLYRVLIIKIVNYYILHDCLQGKRLARVKYACGAMRRAKLSWTQKQYKNTWWIKAIVK